MAQTSAQAPATLPAINVTGSQSLQLPFIADPGKSDDIHVHDEKLDFSVRLGTSLSRGSDSDMGRIGRKDLHLKSPMELSPRNGSQRTTPSPRNGARDREFSSPRAPAKTLTTSRSRRELRRTSSTRTISRVHSYTSEKETARKKIGRLFNTVRIISGICLALRRYVSACTTSNWSFLEMYLHVKEDLNRLVVFDPQNFARIEPQRGKLKNLLAIPKAERTGQHIKVILALLRDNSSFQDYPAHVQIQLSRCMEYQSYEARRVILKQGHRPDAFYIMLSGHVIANIKDRSPTTGKEFIKTVKEMGPGSTFGEIALIEGGRRTASIVCKTNVELLVILKDDFDSIIREPLLRQIEEHVTFCKSVPLFTDFPCNLLAENPAQFFFHYFKEDDIVVRDSKESKYIVVVKTGKCTVTSTFVETVRRRRPPVSAASRETQRAFPHFDDMERIKALHRRPKSQGDKLRETICLGLMTGAIDAQRLAEYGPDAQRPQSVKPENNKRRPPPLQKSKTLSDFYQMVDNKRRESIITEESFHSNFQSNFWGNKLRNVTKGKTRASSSARKYLSSGRVTPSRGSGKKQTNPFYMEEKTSFAQIAELMEGMVFGLESLVQKPSTRFSLISEGAECIFISKRLFLENANLKVLRIVTDMVQTYPSQEFIEEQVQNYRNWQKYKSGLVQGIRDRRR